LAIQETDCSLKRPSRLGTKRTINQTLEDPGLSLNIFMRFSFISFFTIVLLDSKR